MSGDGGEVGELAAVTINLLFHLITHQIAPTSKLIGREDTEFPEESWQQSPVPAPYSHSTPDQPDQGRGNG